MLLELRFYLQEFVLWGQVVVSGCLSASLWHCDRLSGLSSFDSVITYENGY